MGRCERLVLVTGLGLAIACRARIPPPLNLLLVIETLRADHLGCYGHASARTPVLDGLAATGLRLTRPPPSCP